ncbi:MAG: ABC transporter permease [Chloroflexota bacterium]
MTRLQSALITDFVVQVKNKLYIIGIAVAILVALALSQLANPSVLSIWVPSLMLLAVGSTTLLYVSGMVIFEKDEGTLNAIIVSPLRPSEYLWSKIITLTLLATVESIVMIGGTMLIFSLSFNLTWPNIPILLLGIIAIGMIYTLIGIILVVRFDTITDFLIPMAALAVPLQIPVLYFLGVIDSPVLLLIPTSAPTILMQGAYTAIPNWHWIYGIGYSALMIIGLTIWAYRAFDTHIVRKVG